MKKQPVLKLSDCVAFVALVLFILFFAFPLTRKMYNTAYSFFPLGLSFIKFSLLATFGEVLVDRIETGKYLKRGFGLVPKMLVWGFLGIFIYWTFLIFSSGVTFLFFNGKPSQTIPFMVLQAFLISLFMNIIFAPSMMLVHHITDIFIVENYGHFPLSKIDIVSLLGKVDWERMWGFIYARTIPFFWIPAHTVTFLLPPEFRILFAAFLSVVLGLLLSTAKRRSTV